MFKARVLGGQLGARDTSEIAETIYESVEQLQGPIRQALLDSGCRLLAYRVALTDGAVGILQGMESDVLA